MDATTVAMLLEVYKKHKGIIEALRDDRPCFYRARFSSDVTVTYDPATNMADVKAVKHG